MKQLLSIIFLLYAAFFADIIASSTDTQLPNQTDAQVFIEQTGADASDNITDAIYQQNDEPETVIYFFAHNHDQEGDRPSGRYWPSPEIITDHGKPINSASAYIKDDCYSNVSEEKTRLAHDELHYLGYFTNPASGEFMYLYGTKDHIAHNDIDHEDDMNSDDDENNEDEDSQDDENQ